MCKKHFSSSIHIYMSFADIRDSSDHQLRKTTTSIPSIMNLKKDSAEKGKQKYIVAELLFK